METSTPQCLDDPWRPHGAHLLALSLLGCPDSWWRLHQTLILVTHCEAFWMASDGRWRRRGRKGRWLSCDDNQQGSWRFPEISLGYFGKGWSPSGSGRQGWGKGGQVFGEGLSLLAVWAVKASVTEFRNQAGEVWFYELHRREIQHKCWCAFICKKKTTKPKKTEGGRKTEGTRILLPSQKLYF